MIRRLAFIRLFFLLLAILCVDRIAAEENFILIDGMTNQVITEYGQNVDQPISPCSTFKVPLSLIGYDAGLLIDQINPTWDFQEGYDDWLAAWKAPQSPLTWMQYSCIWYSKVLCEELGLEKVQTYLASFDYGSQDITGDSPFWVNSSLKISLRDQVVFIQKMLKGELPVSAQAIQMTKSILFKEDLPKGWKLFGKTGWSGSTITKDGINLEHSWFIGWIEKEQDFYPFAYLIRDKEIDLERRIPRVKEILDESTVFDRPEP